MKLKVSSQAIAIGLAMTLGLSMSCSKKSSDKATAVAAETSIKLSGTLAVTGQVAGLRLTDTVDVATLKVYCVSFSVPPVAGTGAIAADGAFSVTLETTGVSVGCFILDASDAILGTMVFKDPSKTDLNGAAKSADRFALEGGESNLGAITLNLSTGKAEVDITKIVGKVKDTSAALADAYDFTGTYEFAKSGETLPEGYSDACTEEESSHGKDGPKGEASANLQGDRDEGCHGPTIGEELYFQRIKANVPGRSTPAYAMALWRSAESPAACGNKLGFSFAEGIEHGIDFTNSGIGEGQFTWTGGFEDGWKDVANARATHSMMKMEMVDNFKGYPGTKQWFKQYRTYDCNNQGPGPCVESDPIVAEGFQFNANTNDAGCRNKATGKSIQLNDWSNMNCSNETLTGDSAGLQKNVCSKTTEEGVEVECSHIGGTFTANGTAIGNNAVTRYPEDYVVYAQGSFCDYNSNATFEPEEWPQWSGNGQSCNTGTTLTPGTKCADINVTTEAGELAQLRCYADSMYNNENNNEGNGDGSTCQRDIRTNWSAKTPEEFISGKSKPRNQHVFELLEYDSPTSASVRGEERDVRGIQVGDNFTDCEIINTFSLSVKKLDGSNDIFAELIEGEKNISPKPACAVEYPDQEPRKMMFKMIKK